MATATRKKKPGSGMGPIGASPTNSQKLIYVAQKLKLDALMEMQGTTFNLTDTTIFTPSAQRQTLQFFVSTTNKSRTFSNFQTGTLAAGEALVAEYITFSLLVLTSADLNSNTNQILLDIPFSQIDKLSQPKALQNGLMTLEIANSTVIKDYSINETAPVNNPQATGLAVATLLFPVAAPTLGEFDVQYPIIGPSRIPLEAPPVIPPNQRIKLTLDIPPCDASSYGGSALAIKVTIGRFGCIFSAGTTL